MSSFHDISSHSFSTTWRKALVSLPRLVPDAVLRLTSPDGPHPFVLKLPASPPNNHEIPVYVFVYVPPPGLSSPPSSAGAGSPQPSPIDVQANTKSPFGSKDAPGAEVHRLNLPVLIDFHGGSFILGTPQEQAPFCAQMARGIGATCQGGGCVVISVDYRLGPYAHYPAANEDAEDVVRAVLEESSEAGKVLREGIRDNVAKMRRREEWVDVDKTRIALSGFSSGGNLALTLALNVKNDPTINRDWPSVFPSHFGRQIPILLFYPSLDSTLLPDERPRPPGLDPPAGFFTRMKIESELMPKYLPLSQRAHPHASPGLAPIADGGLHIKAKVMLILPELDSLSEQSMLWIKKVEAEGREDDLVVEMVPGVMHGWTQFPDSWLKNDDERRKKFQVFEKARHFVEVVWEAG